MEHQKAFDDVKVSVAKDVALAYPDFLEEFEYYTDGYSCQIGAVITQDNRPLAFFSRNWQNERKSTVLLKLNSDLSQGH